MDFIKNHGLKKDEKKEIVNNVIYKKSIINREKNEENVKVIVENINNNNNIEKVVNKDMKGQQEAFLKRLNERKNKKLLSTSDCTEAIETVKNRRMPNKNFNNSQILFNKDDKENFNIKDLVEDEDKFMLDTSIEMINSTLNESKKKSFINLNESTIFKTGPKHVELMNNFNNGIQSFLDNISAIISNEMLSKYNDELNDLYNEKFSKKFVIYKNYNSQIAEMELMMNEDENHKANLKVIVEDLINERESEIKKLDEEFNLLIESKKSLVNQQSINQNSNVILSQEKFKIDMLNSLNEVIYKK